MKKSIFKIVLPLLAVALVGVVFATSCEKGDNTVHQQGYGLIGKWKWEITSGGFSGRDNVTPASSGYTMYLSFDRNTYTIFKDGRKFFSGEYSLEPSTDDNPFGMGTCYIFRTTADPVLLDSHTLNLVFSDGVTIGYYDNGNRGRVLYTSDNMFDGYSSSFSRMY